MPNDPEFDAFGDIISKQAGIFGDDTPSLVNSLGEHDSVKTVPTAQGVIVEMYCRGCGRPCRIVVEWPELIAVKYNVSPRQAFGHLPSVLQEPVEWMFSGVTGMWYPDQKCSHCHSPCNPHFSSAEAEHHLGTARKNNWINAQGEQQLSQLAAQTRQRQAQVGR